MSNSKLVTYTRISPNRTSPRNGVIRGVAIHCTAGGRNKRARDTADLGRFTTYDRKNGASCNYAVGGDGSIALVVPESDRAWCTSNPIDHQIVSIEVASDIDAPNRVTDKAMSALLDLLTDICRRNGIPALLWHGRRDLMGNWAAQNMVVHRWTRTDKVCPGDYLYNLHPWIAGQVNARLAGREDDDMDIDKLIEEMTGAQAYALYTRAMTYAAAQSEPEWSQKQGHWQAATLKGVVDGTEPERPVKRDELAAVLGRLGLFE